jgi:hypothetical protein
MSKAGGARAGSGRKKATEPLKHGSLRLSQKNWDTLKKLGGSKWLRNYLSQYVDKVIDRNHNM